MDDDEGLCQDQGIIKFHGSITRWNQVDQILVKVFHDHPLTWKARKTVPIMALILPRMKKSPKMILNHFPVYSKKGESETPTLKVIIFCKNFHDSQGAFTVLEHMRSHIWYQSISIGLLDEELSIALLCTSLPLEEWNQRSRWSGSVA